MKNYQNYTQQQGINTVFQYLAFLHTPDAQAIFLEMANDDFDINWYNCDAENASALKALLQMANMYNAFQQDTPEITVFLPAMIKQSFENVVNRLGMYERLLDKLASEKLSASQIETEILKVAMLYNRNRMSNLYYS